MKTIRLMQGPVVHIPGESNPIDLSSQVMHDDITIREDPIGSLPPSYWQDGTVDVVVSTQGPGIQCQELQMARASYTELMGGIRQ